MLLQGKSNLYMNELRKRKAAEERRDFRTIATFTIDPEDAKDFDDAISIVPLGGNRFELGIHIADVTHYVPFNSVIDKHAQKAGTSVYLVDETVHMLPSELSTDVCSLVPKKDRLTFSVVVTITTQGKVEDTWIGKTIINSRKRFSYKEAQGVLNAKTGVLAKELQHMRTIARALKQERMKHGAIEFGSEEIGFTLKNGLITDAFVKPYYETMGMIEECMLLANRLVAAYMHKALKHTKGMTGVYRVHDAPHGDKLHVLESLLSAFGYTLQKQKGLVTSSSIERVLEQAKGTPEYDCINLSLLRSMPKATYDYRNTGHFGLGFSHYTHFTSPIRRYPDMMVHRILHALLTNSTLPQREVLAYRSLVIKNTEQEIGAQEAERDSIKYALVRYWEPRLGTICTGSVSGVVPYGIFVRDSKTHAEGFVHVTRLRKYGYLHYNEATLSLENEEMTFHLGDTLRFAFTGIKEDRNQLEADIA
ncbi:MAG: ribonuclease [Candidatus Parcubacteria bacterium]